MRTVRFMLVGWLVLGLASCGLRGTSTGGPPEPEVEASGHLGSASGGSADAHYAITSPFLQQGDRMTVVLLGEYPGRPLQPAAVLLLRLPSRTNFSRTGSGGEDGDRTYWEQRFDAAGVAKYPARYEIRHKPVAEQLTLGEQPRLLGDGRLFLVLCHTCNFG